MSRTYVLVHYLIGLLLFISAPSPAILKGILAALYALLVPLFFFMARNGDRELGFLGYFTLAAYPFFASALHILYDGATSRSFLVLALSCLLSVTAVLSYRRAFPRPAWSSTETTEGVKESEGSWSPLENAEPQDLEAWISRMEEIIKEERGKNEELREKTRKIKEKIDSLQGL